MFESLWIPCKHSFAVMKAEHLQLIPSDIYNEKMDAICKVWPTFPNMIPKFQVMLYTWHTNHTIQYNALSANINQSRD